MALTPLCRFVDVAAKLALLQQQLVATEATPVAVKPQVCCLSRLPKSYVGQFCRCKTARCVRACVRACVCVCVRARACVYTCYVVINLL